MFKRPSRTETEDDLLKLQESMNLSSLKPMDPQVFVLSEIKERPTSAVLEPFRTSQSAGFPKPAHRSLFSFNSSGSESKFKSKSPASIYKSKVTTELKSNEKQEISDQNTKSLASLSTIEIQEFASELLQTLDPEMIEFIKKRASDKSRDAECSDKEPVAVKKLESQEETKKGANQFDLNQIEIDQDSKQDLASLLLLTRSSVPSQRTHAVTSISKRLLSQMQTPAPPAAQHATIPLYLSALLSDANKTVRTVAQECMAIFLHTHYDWIWSALSRHYRIHPSPNIVKAFGRRVRGVVEGKFEQSEGLEGLAQLFQYDYIAGILQTDMIDVLDLQNTAVLSCLARDPRVSAVLVSRDTFMDAVIKALSVEWPSVCDPVPLISLVTTLASSHAPLVDNVVDVVLRFIAVPSAQITCLKQAAIEIIRDAVWGLLRVLFANGLAKRVAEDCAGLLLDAPVSTAWIKCVHEIQGDATPYVSRVLVSVGESHDLEWWEAAFTLIAKYVDSIAFNAQLADLLADTLSFDADTVLASIILEFGGVVLMQQPHAPISNDARIALASHLLDTSISCAALSSYLSLCTLLSRHSPRWKEKTIHTLQRLSTLLESIKNYSQIPRTDFLRVFTFGWSRLQYAFLHAAGGLTPYKPDSTLAPTTQIISTAVSYLYNALPTQEQDCYRVLHTTLLGASWYAEYTPKFLPQSFGILKDYFDKNMWDLAETDGNLVGIGLPVCQTWYYAPLLHMVDEYNQGKAVDPMLVSDLLGFCIEIDSYIPHSVYGGQLAATAWKFVAISHVFLLDTVFLDPVVSERIEKLLTLYFSNMPECSNENIRKFAYLVTSTSSQFKFYTHYTALLEAYKQKSFNNVAFQKILLVPFMSGFDADFRILFLAEMYELMAFFEFDSFWVGSEWFGIREEREGVVDGVKKVVGRSEGFLKDVFEVVLRNSKERTD